MQSVDAVLGQAAADLDAIGARWAVIGAIQADAGLIYGNYIHSEMPGTGKVAGVESNSGTSPLVIEHNTIGVGASRAYAFGLFPGHNPQANRYIDGNLLAGGSYVIYGGDSAAEPSSNIQVTGNRFSRAFYPRGGYYGPVAHYRSGGPKNAWYASFWDDTLAPVPAPCAGLAPFPPDRRDQMAVRPPSAAITAPVT